MDMATDKPWLKVLVGISIILCMLASVSFCRGEPPIVIPQPTVTPIIITPAPSPVVGTPCKYVYYDVPLSAEVQEYIQDTCEEFGFKRVDVVIGLIGWESSYTATAVSSTDDYGYMQINASNAEWLRDAIGVTDFINDWRQNIRAGVFFLDSMYDYFEDMSYALIGYNAGLNMALQYKQLGVEDNDYSRGVLGVVKSLAIKDAGMDFHA